MPIYSLFCHWYMSNSSLHFYYEYKVHTLVAQWVCTTTHLEFFVEGVSYIFNCCCSPSCIKLGLCTLIGYSFYDSLCCNHCLCYFLALFSSLSFHLVLLCSFAIIFSNFFCKIFKYSVQVTTCDLK